MSREVSTKRQQLTERARSDKNYEFRSIAHLIDKQHLREAYEALNKKAAAGIDGETKAAFGAELWSNLELLHSELTRKNYRAKPARRVWIGKDSGGQRPLGIPAFRDKVVQKAVQNLMEPLYEPLFHSFSHGYRPGKGARTALEEIYKGMYANRVNYIIDADIKGYFDTINHQKLRELIKKRVPDGGIMRLLGKWLKAGVLECGVLSNTDTGTPQGSVISPLLANIYLHYVLDEWYVHEVKPRLKGRSFLIRYADDFIIGCEKEEDAHRLYKVLPKRLDKFGLTMNREKTRLINFGRPRGQGNENQTFNFLGFTFYWGKTRKGRWAIQKKTAGSRLRRAIKRASHWCRDNRHEPLKEQHRKLCQKLSGHYQYFGVTGNYDQLATLRYYVEQAWHKWLSRRSRKSYIPWSRFQKILATYPLPRPVIYHAY